MPGNAEETGGGVGIGGRATLEVEAKAEDVSKKQKQQVNLYSDETYGMMGCIARFDKLRYVRRPSRARS